MKFVFLINVLNLCLIPCSIHFYCVGEDQILRDCRVGITTKEKLRKVIKWVLRAGPTLHNVELHVYQVLSLLSNVCGYSSVL